MASEAPGLLLIYKRASLKGKVGSTPPASVVVQCVRGQHASSVVVLCVRGQHALSVFVLCVRGQHTSCKRICIVCAWAAHLLQV